MTLAMMQRPEEVRRNCSGSADLRINFCFLLGAEYCGTSMELFFLCDLISDDGMLQHST